MTHFTTMQKKKFDFLIMALFPPCERKGTIQDFIDHCYVKCDQFLDSKALNQIGIKLSNYDLVQEKRHFHR